MKILRKYEMILEKSFPYLNIALNAYIFITLNYTVLGHAKCLV